MDTKRIEKTAEYGCASVAFLSFLVVLWLGYVVIAGVIRNWEIHPVTLQELASAPPPEHLWVRVTGDVVADSKVTKDGVDYVLIEDKNARVAVFIYLAKDSDLLTKKNPVTLDGYVFPVADQATLPELKGVPEDTAIPKLILMENVEPFGGVQLVGIVLGLGCVGLFWLSLAVYAATYSERKAKA